ncbi:hypothetical protein D3C85_803520 [compost metagenome]
MFSGQFSVGSSVSVTMILNEAVAVLPDASVTSNVFVVTPTGNTFPEANPAV